MKKKVFLSNSNPTLMQSARKINAQIPIEIAENDLKFFKIIEYKHIFHINVQNSISWSGFHHDHQGTMQKKSNYLEFSHM